MTDRADGESATAVDHADDDPGVEPETARDDEHLADVEEGAGCTEIWEHLSDQREAANDD
jgi:hypothetical protein